MKQPLAFIFLPPPVPKNTLLTSFPVPQGHTSCLHLHICFLASIFLPPTSSPLQSSEDLSPFSLMLHSPYLNGFVFQLLTALPLVRVGGGIAGVATDVAAAVATPVAVSS